jgi:TorA maturation chaperone TorD
VRLADLATFRRASYWLFGASLLYPTEERFAAISSAARALQGQGEGLEKFAFYLHWQKFLEAIGRCVDSGNTELEEAYSDLFVVNRNVPLCESGFLSPGAPAQTMATLEQEYSAAGLSVASSFEEPPDHAAVELEFMSLLCEAEASAWTKRSTQDSIKQLEEESRFLERHLSRWFPALVEEVSIRAAGGFYACVTQATHAFIEHDRGLLAALLGQYREKGKYG